MLLRSVNRQVFPRVWETVQSLQDISSVNRAVLQSAWDELGGVIWPHIGNNES